MANYGHIIFFSLIGGIFSLIGGTLLLSRKGMAEKLAKYATPFAAGALLAAVFLDLLKEGLEMATSNTVLLSALVGILLFFFAERFLHWFHHHHQHDDHADPNRSLIIIGDTVHNALDGIAIAAAFLISIPTGIVTTIAVAAHEIPQEIGDFGLFLNKGMTRRKVLLVNIMSALATTGAAVITFALGSEDRLPTGVLLGLSAGFLLYIAMSDVIPELHERTTSKRFWSLQPLLLVAGVLIVGLAVDISHRYIHEEHDHGTHEAVGDHHSHAENFELENVGTAPEINAQLLPDSLGGYNLLVETTNFIFAPAAAGGAAIANEGHAHVYVNGEKYARLYGNAIHIPELRTGDRVRVTLNANDHRPFSYAGSAVQVEIVAAESTNQKPSDDGEHSNEHGDEHEDGHDHDHAH